MKKSNRIHQFLLISFFTVFCAIIILPFLTLVSVSLSETSLLAEKGYGILPRGFSLEAYKFVFENPRQILRAYGVTAAFSALSMILCTAFTALLAYPLTRRDFKHRQLISFYMYFTILFGGGMVPTYILYTRYLHLGNTFWVYVIPGLVAPWNAFMMRTFFNGIPYDITESAIIDGANDYQIFFRIILPLSKPVLATMALTTFLGKWNDWQTSLLYITDSELISLQYFLKRLMDNIDLLRTMPASIQVHVKDIPAEPVRMAMAVAVAGPALFVFPFFQKYFVKGMTVGSVKG